MEDFENEPTTKYTACKDGLALVHPTTCFARSSYQVLSTKTAQARVGLIGGVRDASLGSEQESLRGASIDFAIENKSLSDMMEYSQHNILYPVKSDLHAPTSKLLLPCERKKPIFRL